MLQSSARLLRPIRNRAFQPHSNSYCSSTSPSDEGTSLCRVIISPSQRQHLSLQICANFDKLFSFSPTNLLFFSLPSQSMQLTALELPQQDFCGRPVKSALPKLLERHLHLLPHLNTNMMHRVREFRSANGLWTRYKA